MSLTTEIREAVSAVINAGDEKVPLPKPVLDFLAYLSTGIMSWSGAPITAIDAIRAVLTEAWRAPDNGKIPHGTALTLKTSGAKVTWHKSGFVGVSIVRYLDGQLRVVPDSEIVVPTPAAEPSSPLPPAERAPKRTPAATAASG